MSLVHEALERAREEAARREALERGEAPAPRAAPPQVRFGAGRPLALAAAALLIGLAGFGLAMLVRRPPAPAALGSPNLAPAPSARSPLPSSPPAAADNNPPAAPAGTPPEPSSPASVTTTVPPARSGAERRPPARSPALPDGTALELQGIVWSSEFPTAVINGAVLAPGEALGGLTLLRVEPRAVVLGDGEREIELRLEPAAAAGPPGAP